MNGRRGHPRFAISTSAEAVLRVLRDVTLERSDEHEIIAISRDAGVVGEHLKLDTTTEDNHTTEVCIADSRPVVIDGAVRHRLRLEHVPERHGAHGAQPERKSPGYAGDLGVLTREIRVRVINCSLCGCLIESHVRLDVGTVVALRLLIDGREFVDEVQLVRCQAVEGAGSLYHLGARHLWIAPPDQGSLRRLATQYLAAASRVQPELR